VTELPLIDERARLRADCSRCAGLCCVAPAFAASADFAIDKPAGVACPNLRDDFRCGIHARLRERGFRGCTVFDCFGAGQRITQDTFGGRAWRDEPGLAAAQFAALPVMRQLHEALWYLVEAESLAPSLAAEVRALRALTERLAGGTPGELAAVDVGAHRAAVGELLSRVSEQVRGSGRPDRRGADLMGRDLRRSTLRDASLRGAYLIGADLRCVDLGAADLLGADLRDADVRGADLAGCLFLTQPQVDAARGDMSTRLPGALRRPAHWH
jgi:Pentapeptide repeats (8 copies)